MKRLVLVSGPAQILFLSAALLRDERERKNAALDSLVFISPCYSIEQKEICYDIAKSVWEWDNIIWLNETDYFDGAYFKCLSSIFECTFDQIWLAMPFGRVEMEFRKYFFNVPVTLYDDGLASILYWNKWRVLVHLSILKKIVLLYVYQWLNYLRYFKSSEHKILPKLLPRIRYSLFNGVRAVRRNSQYNISVEWSCLKQQLDKINIPNVSGKIQGKTCLILGQYFSSTGVISRNKEIEHYTKLCEHFRSRGYAVFWKEHPKNKLPYFDELIVSLDYVQDLNQYYPSLLPIEIVGKDLGIDVFVSVTSSSLLILNQAFGFRIVSSAPVLVNYLNGADRKIADFLMSWLREDQLILK